jgi:hypothetical protein
MIIETYRNVDIYKVEKAGRTTYKVGSNSRLTIEGARQHIDRTVYGTNIYIEYLSEEYSMENDYTLEFLTQLKGSKSNIGGFSHPVMQLAVI